MLLPFHNQITYDGQCRYYNIFFGSGMTRRLNDSYQLAKAHYGIITSLPVEVRTGAPSEEDQLKFWFCRKFWFEAICGMVSPSSPCCQGGERPWRSASKGRISVVSL